ncbi:MAG: hypothetical protein U0324_44295 [Polyangiales bacterium]
MSHRHPKVTETRFHPKGCACGGDECIARQIKLDVTAVYDGPAPARCDDPLSLLRAEDDVDVAARRGGAR